MSDRICTCDVCIPTPQVGAFDCSATDTIKFIFRACVGRTHEISVPGRVTYRLPNARKNSRNGGTRTHGGKILAPKASGIAANLHSDKLILPSLNVFKELKNGRRFLAFNQALLLSAYNLPTHPFGNYLGNVPTVYDT